MSGSKHYKITANKNTASLKAWRRIESRNIFLLTVGVRIYRNNIKKYLLIKFISELA